MMDKLMADRFKLTGLNAPIRYSGATTATSTSSAINATALSANIQRDRQRVSIKIPKPTSSAPETFNNKGR